MKKVLKTIGCIIVIAVIAFGALIGWLTAAEYRPAAVVDIPLQADQASRTLHQGFACSDHNPVQLKVTLM